MTNKYKQAIRTYEEARQKVSRIEKKRKSLIIGCTKKSKENCDDFGTCYGTCLEKAYEDTGKQIRENNEYYSFSEILEEGHAAGDYCDNCVDAYHLRVGELSEARMAFGVAKRQLSAIGKKIIKG